jgi:tetratricopeptide (TPR) repeat protein
LKRHWVAFVIAASLVAKAAGAQDDDARRERARQLYDAAAKHYEHHEYELAIDAFKSAYALSGRANLLFNIAVAYEEWSGHCDDAREFYRRYLALKPDATDRGNVERRLARIELICPSTPTVTVTPVPTITPPPQPPPALPPPKRRLNAAPLVIATVGFVVAGGGAVTLGVTALKYADFTKTCSFSSPCPPSAWQGWQAAEYVSYALLAVGGVALASGLLWFAVHPGVSGGATVVVGGTF